MLLLKWMLEVLLTCVLAVCLLLRSASRQLFQSRRICLFGHPPGTLGCYGCAVDTVGVSSADWTLVSMLSIINCCVCLVLCVAAVQW